MPDEIYKEIEDFVKNDLEVIFNELQKLLVSPEIDLSQDQAYGLTEERFRIISETIAILFDKKHFLRKLIRKQLAIYLNFEIEKVVKDSKKPIG